MDRFNPRTSYRCLRREAMPSVTASTAIFANAHDDTKEIRMTVRTAAITMAGPGDGFPNGGTPVTATTTVGLDFAVNSASSPYVIETNATIAKAMRAIQNGGTAAGYIEYWG